MQFHVICGLDDGKGRISKGCQALLQRKPFEKSDEINDIFDDFGAILCSVIEFLRISFRSVTLKLLTFFSIQI